MSSLLLVRHGQASFGAANYDQLSARGAEQCRRLGAHWAARGLAPEVVAAGTLARHHQSLAAIADGLGGPLPPTRVFAGLDEYDSVALIEAVGTEGLPSPHTPEGYRAHFRRLREALLGWMAGQIHPRGLPTYADFRANARAAIDTLHDAHPQQTVLVLSSGGPISAILGSLLGAHDEAVVELNMRMRNSAVSELVGSRQGPRLFTFNQLPHLDAPGDQKLHTHA